MIIYCLIGLLGMVINLYGTELNIRYGIETREETFSKLGFWISNIIAWVLFWPIVVICLVIRVIIYCNQKTES